MHAFAGPGGTNQDMNEAAVYGVWGPTRWSGRCNCEGWLNLRWRDQGEHEHKHHEETGRQSDGDARCVREEERAH